MGYTPWGRWKQAYVAFFSQIALLVLVQELVDLSGSINVLEVVNIVLTLGPTNIGRHQAAIGVEGKLVSLRKALAQRAASINSQVDTVDVSGSGREQEDHTGGNLRLSTVASGGALLSLEHMKRWSE